MLNEKENILSEFKKKSEMDKNAIEKSNKENEKFKLAEKENAN